VEGKGGKAMVASGSEDGAIVLWDVNSKAVLQRLEGHEGPVMGVDVDASGTKIVSCGMDKTIRLWRDSRRAGGKSAKSVKDTGDVNGY
jgi:COMPASS component SWD3